MVLQDILHNEYSTYNNVPSRTFSRSRAKRRRTTLLKKVSYLIGIILKELMITYIF
ncbi:hypothetical protein SAMN04488601_10342 [Paenibacillus sp. 453mf]|nr:hypothetical protein SAMN04488601_10342 [Paenibacillus sp. 453mf]